MTSTGFPLIINKSHHIGGGRYAYRFGRSVDFSDIDIALGSVSLYYSWRNVTAALANNTFTIVHPATLETNVTLNLTIPDGGYEVADLNNFLRWYLIQNGYYIQNDTTGNQIVYAEFRLNPSTYSIEFVSYPLPTSLPTGYTAGSAITFPSTTRAPQLTVSTAGFGTLIGFATGTFPSSQQTVLTTTASTLTPVLTNVLNVLVNLDCVDNPFSPTSTVIHALSSAGTPYGHLISDAPNTLSFIPCQHTSRQEIILQFTDQLGLPLQMIDYDVCVKLVLARKLV